MNDYDTGNKIIKKEVGISKYDFQITQLKENKNNVKIKIGALNNSKVDLLNLINTE